MTAGMAHHGQGLLDLIRGLRNVVEAVVCGFWRLQHDEISRSALLLPMHCQDACAGWQSESKSRLQARLCDGGLGSRPNCGVLLAQVELSAPIDQDPFKPPACLDVMLCS